MRRVPRVTSKFKRKSVEWTKHILQVDHRAPDGILVRKIQKSKVAKYGWVWYVRSSHDSQEFLEIIGFVGTLPRDAIKFKFLPNRRKVYVWTDDPKLVCAIDSYWINT